MECLLENEYLSAWLLQYGSFALFSLLVVGIIALPVPEETLMVVTGILMGQGKLNIPVTVFAAYAGSICGITISYLLGKTLGYYFVHRYGSWVGLTEKKLAKAHLWFERVGKWALVIGYFIPGVRHFTGFSVGTTKMQYGKFALFAYTGALLWVSTFLSLGYFYSDQCITIFDSIKIGGEALIVAIFVLFSLYMLYHVFIEAKHEEL